MLIDTSSERSIDEVPVAAMLRSLVVDAFELAIEALGPEEFGARIDPYYRHAAEAMLLNLEEAKLIDPEDPLRRLRAFEFSGHLSGGVAFEEMSHNGDKIVWKIKRCGAADSTGRSAATRGAYCRFNQEVANRYWLSEMKPERELICLSSHAEGSDRCVEIIVPKGRRDLAEIDTDQVPMPKMKFDDSLLAYYPAAYLIETWILIMVIIAGEIGEDATRGRMKDRIEQRSGEYALILGEVPEGVLSRAFTELLVSFWPTRGEKGTLLAIDSCPLSAGSPFCCGLFLDLLNGIIRDEAGRKLEHVSMVTKGDAHCQMLLTESSPLKNKNGQEDPAKILKLRLAKGEITVEEFERVRSYL
jgi:hypothetical protein